MTTIDFNQIDPKADEQALVLLANMTLEEKVGQMCQIHPPMTGQEQTEQRIRRGHVGEIRTPDDATSGGYAHELQDQFNQQLDDQRQSDPRPEKRGQPKNT